LKKVSGFAMGGDARGVFSRMMIKLISGLRDRGDNGWRGRFKLGVVPHALAPLLKKGDKKCIKGGDGKQNRLFQNPGPCARKTPSQGGQGEGKEFLG